MSPNSPRPWLFAGIAACWLTGVLAIFAFTARKHPETVVVVQWANAHPMRQGLLPEMASRFNKRGHTTPSGKRIEIRVYRYDSAPQVEDLTSRIVRGVALDPKLPDQVIVTPQADHWLVHANYTAGRTVVDPGQSHIKLVAHVSYPGRE